MSAQHAATARIRARVRREINEAEEAGHEGGELNLVPYLDIITNTVIFMLATTALTVALANINVSAPRYRDSAQASAAAGDDEDKPKLNLTVGITYTGFTIGGSSAILPKIPCGAPLRNGRCPAYVTKVPTEDGGEVTKWVDEYNYAGLAEKLKEIKLYKGEDGQYLYRHERQAILTADRRVPYNIVVRTMDTIRGAVTPACTGDDGCLFDQVILSAGVR